MDKRSETPDRLSESPERPLKKESSFSSLTGTPPRQKARSKTFAARSSRLDSETINREQNPFRGFFTFFWIFLVYYALYSLYSNYKKYGTLLHFNLGQVAVRNLERLALADALMLFSTFSVVIIVKLVNAGYLPATPMLQHFFQSTWFSVCLGYIYTGGFNWLQSGSFLMHVLTNLMKMHSYLSVNLEMKLNQKRLEYCLELRQKYLNQPSANDSIEDPLVIIDDEIKDLTTDLSNDNVVWPQNVTFANYFDFLLIPTLVYELAYPRKESIRIHYLIEKAVGTVDPF